MKIIEYKFHQFNNLHRFYSYQRADEFTRIITVMSEDGWIYKEMVDVQDDSGPVLVFYKFDETFLQYNKEIADYIKTT